MSRTVEELEDDNARLRAILKPFAHAFTEQHVTLVDNTPIQIDIPVGALRAARAEIRSGLATFSVPGYIEMEEAYNRAYTDWQAVSRALLGREHGTCEDLLRKIAKANASAQF